MKITQTASCLLVALAGLVGCEKPERNVPIVLVPDEIKSYGIFKPGTWWVYQDSTSTALDSVWVAGRDSTGITITDHGEVLSKNELFTTTTFSRLDTLRQIKAVTTRKCGYTAGTGPDCWALDYKQSVKPNQHSTVEPIIALVDMRGGLPPGSRSDNTRNLGQQMIGGVTYPTVIRAEGYASDFRLSGRATYEWAPGVGIVRRRVALPQGPGYRTWVLMRAHIVQ